MAVPALLLTASASLAASASFLAVSLVLLRRNYSQDLAKTGRAHSLWWALLSLQAATDAARTLLALGDPVAVDAYVALAYVKIVAASLAIWALARYVLFLWNGESWISFPVAIFAILHAAYFSYGLSQGLPARVQVDAWAPRLILEGPGTGSPLGPLTILLFFLPAAVLAIAYLMLGRHLETRTQKFRVVSIGIAIIVLQVVGTLQFNPNTPANSPIFALLPLVSASMAFLVLAAYVPPGWLSKRFGIDPFQPTVDTEGRTR